MSAVPTAPPALAGLVAIEPVRSGPRFAVWRARATATGAAVAVTIAHEPLGTPAARSAFSARAVLAETVRHPHVLPVTAHGIAGDGRPYVGAPLTDDAVRGGADAAWSRPWQTAPALRALIGLSGALESMHRAGLAHGDVRPHRILLPAPGEIVLTGHGFAAPAGWHPASPIAFAAPETIDPEGAVGRIAGGLSPAADVYALAALAHAMLAGSPPFGDDGDEGGDRRALAARIHSTLPVRLRTPGIPPTLARLVEVGLAADPGARPESAAAFGLALLRIEEELGYARSPFPVSGAARRPADDDPDEATRLSSTGPGAPGHGAPGRGVPVHGAPGDIDEATRLAPIGLPEPVAPDERTRVAPLRVPLGTGAIAVPPAPGPAPGRAEAPEALVHPAWPPRERYGPRRIDELRVRIEPAPEPAPGPEPSVPEASVPGTPRGRTGATATRRRARRRLIAVVIACATLSAGAATAVVVLLGL